MARAGTGDTYRLVYLVFNTIGNLLTQDDQVDCFANAARHLAADGVFLVETGTPASMPSSQFVHAEQVDADAVVLDVCRYDLATQLLEENHVRLDASGVHLGPIAQRLVWPSELDLMARLVGLALRHRWGGWLREPFTSDSLRHVSVYGRRV